MIQYLSLFSGIGAFEKALQRQDVPFELVNYCEIDKYASKSYAAIHNISEDLNLGDITKIDEKSLPKGIDLVTYGFPCQDISLAGKQKGFFHEDGTQTRSGLFFDALRIIEETQPKIAIAENVKNLTGKKFKEQFEIVLSSLEEAGYNNYWQILNAKDYGIPQNRERVFIVSIRKDIDTGIFEFPKGFPLEKRLKDILETEVDEKYYLKKEPTMFLKPDEKKEVHQVAQMYGTEVEPNPSGGRVYDSNYIMRTLGAGNGMSQPIITEPCMIKVGNTTPSGKSQCNDVYSEEGIHPTLCAGTHGNCNSSVLVREATKQGYAEAYEGDSINLEQPNSKTRRGRVGKQVAQTLTTSPQQAVVESFIAASRGRNPENTSDRTTGATTVQRLEPNSQGICNTLTTVQKDNYVCEPQIIEDFYKNRDERIYEEYSPSLRSERNGLKVNNGLRIRKLTPLECFRLMGFDDEDFDLAEKVNSNTQLYKQAGNSIVVNVAEELFCMVLDEKGNIFV